MKEEIGHLMNNPKFASAVSAATTGTGVGTILNWIPNSIGNLATLVGIVLSIVLIYTHWRNGRIKYKKTQLEISILERKERERLESAHRRKAKGLPTRRQEDD